jgi:hypothetical protein
MTDQSFPITPPPELRAQWRTEAPIYRVLSSYREDWFMDRAAQWGWDQRGTINEAQLQERADEELEACCEWLGEDPVAMRHVCTGSYLRAARRLKPPSLKEQALAELDGLRGDASLMGMGFDAPAIRRALEALPND